MRKQYYFLPGLGRSAHFQLFVDNDTAPSYPGQWIGIVCRTQLVVINHSVGCLIPDLDPEPVEAIAAFRLPVDGCEHEPVVARAIDRAGSLVLGPGSRPPHP